MAPRDEHGSTLSVHRAFVVHLGTSGGAGRRRFSGRVEHLSSGQSAPFSSLKGLLAFFATILDAAAPAAGRGLDDRSGATPPSIDRALHPPPRRRQSTTVTAAAQRSRRPTATPPSRQRRHSP